MFAAEKKLVLMHVILAVIALALGTLFGPIQALEHAGINLYPTLQSVGVQSYYQGLTLHGVLNALVWTTVFITGFLTLATVTTLKRPVFKIWISWLGFAMMAVGVLIAAVPLLLNQSSVLYTFYPPLQAPWYYYLGLVIFVVGSWVSGWSIILTVIAWRREHKGETTPFMAFGSVITVVLWQICTLGVASEILALIIPWTLGLVPGIDVQLSRTLFWFTGHPLVYFWLLPAYVSWYGMVPKQAGGKLFSEPLARFSFWLFLLLSTPLGLHHQYLDPGLTEGAKFLMAVLTFAVFFPSMLTAFNVIASLEIGGRARGGKGLLGWIRKLPWNEPSFTAQALAMILFAFGGAGGIVNASYNVNLIIHNTAWVPGHFHLTVGTGVTLTFIGILYWMLPHITGKELWSKRVALWQAWIWFVGMAIFSTGMHRLGLLGAPRRTMLGVAIGNYGTSEWRIPQLMVGIGGMVLFVSAVLFFAQVIMTLRSKKKAEVEMPIAEPLNPEPTPNWLNSWKPWLAGTVGLIVVAYGPVLIQLIGGIASNAAGFQLW